MRFDFEGARKAGLSDSEIVQYISTLPNNGNLDTLKEMGASDSHIVDLLSGSKNFSITNPQESQNAKNNPPSMEQSQIEEPKDVKSLFESIKPATENTPPIAQEQNQTQMKQPIEDIPQEDNMTKIDNPDVSNKPILPEQESTQPLNPAQTEEPPKPKDGSIEVLKDIANNSLGIPFFKQRAKIQQKRNEYLAEQIATKNPKSYNDLNDEEKHFIRDQYQEKNRLLGIRNPFALLVSDDHKFQTIKKDLQEEHQLKQILDSDLSYNDLSLEQKQLINEKMGFFDKTFKKPQEALEELKSTYQIHKIAPTIEKSLSELNNISANKRLYNIFNSDPSLRDKYLQDVYNIATNAGFDNVSVDTAKHKMYLIKDGNAYEAKEGFLDTIWEDIKSSKFELGASLAGALAGAKLAPPTPVTKLAGGIIGGAIGAVGGSGLDYKINSWLLNRQEDSDELLGKMLEAGTLSAVGDVATLGAIKLVKSSYNSLKKIPAYANELRENFTNQNINGAMKLLEDVGISKEKAQSVANQMDKYIETRFVADKENSFLDKALSKVSKINDSVKQKEKIAFDVAYADPVLWKYIGAVAKNEPKFSNFIHNSITERAKKISINPDIKLGDIQTAIKDYEQSLTSQYGEAIDLLDTALPNYRFYPQEFLENKLSKIAEHIGENKSEGIIAGLNNQIKDMGEGLNVSQMIDIRKLINKTLRRNSRFDYNDIGALKDINSYIDSNIEEALLKNAKSEPKLEVLYDEWKKINAKYKDYKELQESKLYKDIFSDNYNNDEKLGNAFINWSKTDERLVDSIIGRLDPRMQDKTQAFILAKSIDKHIQDTLNDGKVVDFLELKKTLSHLEGKITNQSLKDHINILKDMADLFYNDINLMRESGQINILTPNSGSGISHDLIARAHTSTISNIYRTIQRFLPTTAGKNSAFLYHLGKAMNMSRNSKELIFDLVSSPDTPPSLLKELRPAIEAYNGRVGNAIDSAQTIQTQKDQQNYLDMLESSKNYERTLDDTSNNPQALERMETSGVSDVGSTREQAIPHRGDTEGLLPNSGEIRAIHRDRDGEFGRLPRSDEGGDRSLRSRADGRRDGGARTAGKISQEPQEIRETNQSTQRTSRGRLETKQTTESTTITQEGLPPSPSLNNLAKSLKTKDPLENITDFGTNYPEYYHDGKGAIEKLLQTREGQVQGAFYKEGLGDIDLVWGKVTNAEKHTGYGLAHIIDKHPDFNITKIPEIIEKGNLSPRHNGYNLEFENFIVGINKGFDGKGENTWVVTAFDSKKPAKFSSSRDFSENESLSSNLLENPTTEKSKNQDPLENITDFGTNYPEYYHDGKGAIEKLLQTREGQVQGAFYRPDIGDITLVWGKEGTGKSDGFGLAKIAKFHPEALDKLDEIISKGAFLYDEKQRPNIVLDSYIVGIRNDWKGNETPYWVISSYKKDSIKGIDSNGAIAVKENYSLNNPLETNPTTEQLKNQDPLAGITDFGTNYPEYYHDGKGAIEKLLQTREGQVQGAFYKEGLGDIDLVWGNEKMGLAHILDKHPEVIEKIPEIINDGELVVKKHNATQILKDDYKVVLKSNLYGEPTENKWILTAYEDVRGKDKFIDSIPVNPKETLSETSGANPTTEKPKNQHPKKIPLKSLKDIHYEIQKLLNETKKDFDKEQYDNILKNYGIKDIEDSLDVRAYLKSDKELFEYFKHKDYLNHIKTILASKLRKESAQEAQAATKIQDELKEEHNHYRDYTTTILGLSEPKYMIGELKNRAKDPSSLKQDEREILEYFAKEGRSGFEDFSSPLKMNQEELLKAYQNLKDKYHKFSADIFYNEIFGERGDRKIRSISNRYDGILKNIKKYIETKKNQVSSAEELEELKNILTMLEDKEVENFIKNSSYDVLDYLKNLDSLQRAKGRISDFTEYYKQRVQELEEKLFKNSPKEAEFDGSFYREGIGVIHLSKQTLDKIKDNYGRLGVKKVPDIINNGLLFRKDTKGDLYAYKDKFLLKIDSGHNVESIKDISRDDSILKDLHPIGRVTESSQQVEAKKISNNLSKGLKEAYDKYDFTKSKQYQEAKEIQKSEAIVGKSANIIRKEANEIMSKSPLELALHNNWVKETFKEPFGINFKKSIFDPIKGEEALQTLLTYKLGQVKGAFHKEGLGDIDLVWGNEKMGLAHILDKHPEVIDKIPEIIKKGEVIKNGEFETIVLKNNELYKVGLSKGWNGNGENHWILTAYEDTRLPHSDLLPSNGVASRDVLPSNNPVLNPTTEKPKNQDPLENITDFGTNYPEYYHDGKGAIEKLLQTREGQVQGAFYKEGLGDIDLVWGNEKMGLAHILDKHPEVIDKIPEIIEKGKIDKGTNRIFLNTNDSRLAIALDYKGEDKKWIITAYDKDYPSSAYPHQEQLAPATSAHRMQDNLHINPTTEQLKNQELLDTYRKLGKKYQEEDKIFYAYSHYIQKMIEGKNDPYSAAIDGIKTAIDTKKAPSGKKLSKEFIEKLKYVFNMLKDPEVEKFIKSINDDVEEILSLESNIRSYEKRMASNPTSFIKESLATVSEKYKQKMREIYGKYPLEEKQGEDLIKEAFSEIQSQGTLSEITKKALEKNGNKIEMEGENIIISHKTQNTDKDLEPLASPSAPKAIITPSGYTQYDGLGNMIKEVSITPNTLSSTEKQGNITTTETLDLATNKSTKQVEVKNPEINLPLTSPSSSSAPSSSMIAKLKDDFKIDPNASISKSPKKRFDDNIEAIRILKKLEQNKTLPTLEEKQKLSSYVGWGGLANSFKDNTPEDVLLRELLSPQEYARAKNSTLSSYYTPYFVVDSMYKALSKMGFGGGEILEPSLGVGNFFGLLPDNLRYASNLTGIELDNTTAKIAKYLYPSAKIEHMGFESAPLNKNNYDLVIGNPPYGSFSVYDKNFKEESKHNIHNYFMLKNLALTKENGILAQIITTNFLDTKNPEVRNLIAKEAEFLGAIRLPQGSFDDTQVATDIVFFRKLKRGEASPSQEWVNLKSIPDSQGKEDILINSYFADNPQYMLGIPGRYGGMYGADTVGFRSNGNTKIQLQEAIEKMTEGIHIETRPILSSADIAQKTIDNLAPKPTHDLLHSSYIKPGGIAMDSKNGEIYRLNHTELEKVSDLELIDKTQEEFDKLTEVGKKAKLSQIKRIKEMIPAISEIRDTLMGLKRMQLDPMESEVSIETQRKKLNSLYDDFRNTFHTYLNDSKIAKAFDGDPTYPHIASLEEDYKRVDKKYQAKKADIFTKRTQFPYVIPTSAKNIEDGIFISYNQTGKLDFDTIARLLDKDSEVIKKEMLDKNLAYKDEEGNIIYAPEFLSGNIIAKIKSFEDKELDEYQNKALNALFKVVPKKVEIEGISINMGANYIPIEIYQDFAKEVLGGSQKGVSYQKLNDEFIVDFKSSLEADKAFGVEGKYKSISASDIFEAVLNNKKISMGKVVNNISYPDPEGQIAFDQQIGVMKEAFRNFIYEDYKRAQKIENIYNDIFNNSQSREFDGNFLKLEGSNHLISLRPHQKNAIYRIISSPTTLLDHTVGTGKTYTMVGSAMELRRLGLAKKPLFVVPNHIVNQFGAEFARLYPDANILATRKFDKKSRQRTLSSITTGDWDAIIIGHSNFEMLPMSRDSEIGFMMEQIRAYEEAIKTSPEGSLSVKKLESAKQSRKNKLEKLLDSKKDETVDFEELGIDALFLDEAHEYKNLEFFSRQNISGLGNQRGSKKAFDLFMKTRYLKNKNKKIIFATGTPISNSVAELYTLQRYLDFEGLEEKGINSFDQWSKTFGKIEARFEYHPSGDFKLTNRFTGYVNMPELIKEYKKFADVIVNEDVEAMLKLQGKEFDLPKADFITVDIKKSPHQENFMQEIMERSYKIDNRKVEPDVDNYLKVTTDGKKASLDMRLINPLNEDSPDSKVNTSIANILKEYNKWKQDKGTQLVFLDMSTPKNKNPKAKKELDELLKRIEQGDEEAEEILKDKGGSDYIKVVNDDGFSVYEDIKDKLIKAGIPEKEIAFIHDFDTDKKKAELFTKVNDGDVRILLGSTSKMGAGTNVQERIVAIHHLDAPWRPADIEQRNGRGIRQGNSLYEKYGKDKFKVNIYTYVTKGMLDTMIFEKLHTKAKFISQLRKGELNGREIEDIGDEVLNFAEIQAATLEDRRYLKILELKREIDSLTALQKNIANINLRTTREINTLEYDIKHKPKEIQTFKTDMEAFNKGGGKVQINNTTYTRGEKDNGLSQALEGIKIDRDIQSIYKYNGFTIEASVSKRNADFGSIDLIAHSPNTEESYLISTTKKQDFKPNGALIKIDNYFKAPRLIAMQDELKKAQTTLPKLKNSLKKFDKQKELEEKTKQHIKLMEDLRVKLNSHPYVGLGLFGAILGGAIDYNDDGKNDEVDMLLGTLGAIIGGKGVKYLLSKNPSILKNVLLHHFPEKKEEINTAFKKEIQKEKRGIYNVAYNDKKATTIKGDLKSIENMILFERGRDNPYFKPSKGYGFKHIKARHINPKDQGYITQKELLNIGNNMREYLKYHKEPFVDKNGARIYEWKDKNGVNFRVVVGDKINPSKGSTTAVESEDLPLPSDRIITFYSDRNLKRKMEFKNPNLKKGITIW